MIKVDKLFASIYSRIVKALIKKFKISYKVMPFFDGMNPEGH